LLGNQSELKSRRIERPPRLRRDIITRFDSNEGRGEEGGRKLERRITRRTA